MSDIEEINRLFMLGDDAEIDEVFEAVPDYLEQRQHENYVWVAQDALEIWNATHPYEEEECSPFAEFLTAVAYTADRVAKEWVCAALGMEMDELDDKIWQHQRRSSPTSSENT